MLFSSFIFCISYVYHIVYLCVIYPFIVVLVQHAQTIVICRWQQKNTNKTWIYTSRKRKQLSRCFCCKSDMRGSFQLDWPVNDVSQKDISSMIQGQVDSMLLVVFLTCMEDNELGTCAQKSLRGLANYVSLTSRENRM